MDFHFSRFEIATGTGSLFLCLVFVCVFVEAAAIRDETAAAAAAAVRAEPLYWVSVEARGQHLLLAGAAPDARARERAEARAAAVPGASGVDNRITVLGAEGACQERVDDYLQDRRIGFKAGRPELGDGTLPVLAGLAEIVRGCGAAFEVAAHTDATGDAVLNLKLSQRRAESVARYLVQSGVAPAQLRAAGYGERQPVADNRTEAGQAANRRLELRVLGAAS